MKANHTPGPWKYIKELHYIGREDATVAYPYLHRGNWTKESIANTKLIAAAPDQHEANLLSLAVLSDIERAISNEEPLSARMIKGISDAIEANVKAIKKATE